MEGTLRGSIADVLEGQISGSLELLAGEPVLENLSVSSNGVYEPQTGVDGFDKVTVNVPTEEPKLETLNVTQNGTYTPGSGVDGFDEVNVNVQTTQPVLDSIEINENGHFTPPAGTDGYDDITVYVPYVTQGTIINENGTYTPPSGVDGFGRVIVDVPTPPPSLQSLTVSHNGYFLPSSGYDGFSEVNVDVALPQNAYLLESQKNDVVSIQHGAEFDMPKLIVSIELQQSGSGDPSPENVRPISGWTACNVVISGANSWDEEWELGIYNTSTGEKQADNSRIRSKNYISVRPSNSYRIVIPSSTYCRYFCYDINKNLIITEVNQGSATITTPNNCYFMTFNMGQEYGTTYNDNISINYPSTDTSYHAYSGQTINIQFTDGANPLIVYGAQLDVRNGLLTVDRKRIPVDSNWGYSTFGGKNFLFRDHIDDILTTQDNTRHPISSKNPFGGYGGASVFQDYNLYQSANTGVLYIQDSRYTDVTTFRSAYANCDIVYYLATPQTYQLTPTQVKSLLGVNNIFADTGEVDVQVWTKDI